MSTDFARRQTRGFPRSVPRSLPRPWEHAAETESFLKRLRKARRSVLLLDYDGTLAPFRKDRLEALPYPGIESRLATLKHSPSVRLVLVTGRPARELQGLLSRVLGHGPDRSSGLEIWGNHGREHLKPSGSYWLQPLGETQFAAMDAMRQKIVELGFSECIEMKPSSLAIHWRGSSPAVEAQIRSAMEAFYQSSGGQSKLELLAFDGGLELRPNDRTKGTAVEQVLSEEETGLPAAYLGDDLTDEDAFAALGTRGLAVLVREQPRESLANVWIKPPDELLRFLDEWIASSIGGSIRAKSEGPADAATEKASEQVKENPDENPGENRR